MLFIFLALLFGLLGDIVLIKPQEYREKVIGSSLFGVGHVFYLLSIIKTIGLDGFRAWNAAAIAAGALVGFIIYQKNKDPIIEKMRISCLGYFILLGSMVGLSFIAMPISSYGLLWAAGYVMFIVSDALLVNQWFTVGDPYPAKDKLVMITYCAAQLLLTLGFVLI